MEAFERGLVAGLLLAHGSFGGDGRQPHVILRMHARHEPLLRWLADAVPGSRLYGPYHHGDRHYLQWMARGPVLAENLLPMVEAGARLDPPAQERIAAMRARYPEHFGGSPRR